MEIDRFRHDDIDPFLHLAALEGWLCDRWELEFLLRSCPQGCFVVRGDDGPIAFVTAISYGSSGWIGNLIVHGDHRGRGLGKGLMTRALAALHDVGTETVWLTASRAGMPLYERLGFVAIDTVKRWSRTGWEGVSKGTGCLSFEKMLETDRAGWGDKRAVLLAAILERGTVNARKDGFIVTQNCGKLIQLGPWGCRSIEGAATLLDEAVHGTGAKSTLVLDVPGRNVVATALLGGRGFTSRGEAVLMYQGRCPAYRPDYVYALASMGSMG